METIENKYEIKNAVVVSYARNVLKVFKDRESAYKFVCNELDRKIEKPENYYTYYVHNLQGYEIYCL